MTIFVLNFERHAEVWKSGWGERGWAVCKQALSRGKREGGFREPETRPKAEKTEGGTQTQERELIHSTAYEC